MTPEALLAGFAHAPVPRGPARAVMALSLMDWAACGLAGRSEPVSCLLRAAAVAEGARGAATMLGGGRSSPARAALVNGASSHALDYDDTHFAHIGHTSVAVVPAALAMAEALGADFDAMLDASLVGAEAAVRLGVWLGRGHYQLGFHQTATSGAFGATLAAARLAGLTPDQTVMALGLAATRAGGLKSQFGTMGKPYNAGLAAQIGVEVVQLAGAGMTSAVAGLSGAQGYGDTHHGAADASAWDGLGAVWRFGDVHHKFHACCHGLHAMLEALRDAPIGPGPVVAVRIGTHPRWLSVCNIVAPATGLEAKFSYRLTAAMCLAGLNTADTAVYTDALCGDPALIRLRDAVQVIGDDSLTELQSNVTLTLGDGTLIALAHDLAAQMPLADRAQKVRAKAGTLAGEAAAELQAAIDAADLPSFLAVLGRSG